MQRDPQAKSIFFGKEVEQTLMKGMSTMFVAGSHTVSEILGAYAGEHQIYLTANQSYGAWTGTGCNHLCAVITALLAATRAYIAVDVPAAELKSFLDYLPEVTARSTRLIVQISLVAGSDAPQLQNLYLKLDDDVRGPQGPGVWVAEVKPIFTPWEAYSGDSELRTEKSMTDPTLSIMTDGRYHTGVLAALQNADRPIGVAIKRTVTVHFMKRGTHCYPEAATNPALATGDEFDVSYLASPHAHDFWFKVEVGVTHNDRDIEFIQMRMRLEKLYSDGVLQCGRKSCEILAEELIAKIIEMYGQRYVKVGVFEDGLHANGGTVEHTPI